MSGEKYTLSFTTGAALIRESILVAELYVALGNWTDVRFRVLAENSFQSRTISTLKKLYGEVSKRLKHLTDEQLIMLASASEEEVRALVWLAICRQYKFIYEFSIQVIFKHYETAQFLLAHGDFDAFFNEKAEWHDNLDAVTRNTKAKARQVLFKMLTECGLLNTEKEIVPQQLSKQFVATLMQTGIDDLMIFPGAKS